MRRITTMFLLLLGCSGDSDDDTTTTITTITTPPPTMPDITSATDTGAATEPTSTTALPLTTTTADPATSAPTTAGTATSDPDTTAATADVTTSVTTADDTTGTPVDCNAPPDCASCWTCAKNGACKAPYDACAMGAFCIPTLTCIESMCAPDGIQPDCPTTCCKSCANLGTCDDVNAALSCITSTCAAHCGPAMCAG